VKKKVDKVEQKRERRVTREVRYFIFGRTEKGKLKVPMEREMYAYDDSPIFDSSGYETQEKAFEAIESRQIAQDAERDTNGWGRTFFGDGKTYPMTESFFVIPQFTVSVWWEQVD